VRAGRVMGWVDKKRGECSDRDNAVGMEDGGDEARDGHGD